MKQSNFWFLLRICCLGLYMSMCGMYAQGGQDSLLYPFSDKGKWGYINRQGRVVIAPVFNVAGRFSEGLAPVRKRGRYGYTDRDGKMRIGSRYHYAEPFCNGVALVYKKEQPYLARSDGRIQFRGRFKRIWGFDDGKFSEVCGSEKNSMGLIRKDGQLIADTMYHTVLYFQNEGVAIITGGNHKPYVRNGESPVYETGIIDTLGNWVVPFGRFAEIGAFADGVAPVEMIHEEGSGNAFINRHGKLLFIEPADEWRLPYYSTFSEGRMPVDVFLNECKENTGRRKTCAGVVDTNGELLFYNAGWEHIEPFRNGRAFVRQHTGEWLFIDRNGKLLGPAGFYNLGSRVAGTDIPLPAGMHDLVYTRNGWEGIDTAGQLIALPEALRSAQSEIRSEGNWLIFRSKTDSAPAFYGAWNAHTNAIIPCQFNTIEPVYAFCDSCLLLAGTDSGKVYISPETGGVYRQSLNSRPKPQKLNIDYMRALDPHYTHVEKIPAERMKSSKKAEAGIYIEKDPEITFGIMCQGVSIYVANKSKDTLVLPVKNSMLFLTMQARPFGGKWRDIETVPSSGCLQSYTNTIIPPGYGLVETYPRYTGSVPVRLRMKLIVKTKYADKILYSRSFAGRINPAQWWRKQL